MGNPTGEKTNPAVEGSQYLYETFTNGEIYTTPLVRFVDIPMRYNSFLDEIEVKLESEDVYIISDPGKLFKLTLGEEILQYTGYNSKDMQRRGYLFVLYSGQSTLYERKYKVYSSGTISNGIIPATPPHYSERLVEYYSACKGKAPELFNSKKSFLRLVITHKKEMEAFIKSEKINLRNPDDLIKSLSYYDTLE